MTHKFWFVLKAIICLVFAVLFLAVPALAMSLFGVTLDAGGELMARLYGASLTGNLLIHWLGRDSGPSKARMAIVWGGFIYDLVGLVVALVAVLSGIMGVMGWLAVVILPSIIRAMPSLSLVFLFSGAAAFTLGAIIYIIKRPNPVKDFFGFHEIFHVFILIGAGCHYITVLLAVA